MCVLEEFNLTLEKISSCQVAVDHTRMKNLHFNTSILMHLHKLSLFNIAEACSNPIFIV
jgi:hypothetical protein